MSKNTQQNRALEGRKITSVSGVVKAAAYYSGNQSRTSYIESIVLARNTPIEELITSVIPDKDGQPDENGRLKNPILVISSYHYSIIGTLNLSRRALEFINQLDEREFIEPLSVSSGMVDDKLHLLIIVRVYKGKDGEYHFPDFTKIYEFLEEEKAIFRAVNTGLSQKEKPQDVKQVSADQEEFIITDEIKQKLELQAYRLENATDGAPFLNTIDEYISPSIMQPKEDDSVLIYNLADKQRAAYQTYCGYNEFNSIFVEIMSYLTTVEKDAYNNAIGASYYESENLQKDFMRNAQSHINRLFVNTPQKRLPREDVPLLLKRVERSLFELYIIQDLIDDPDITDIKITDPYSIRVRIRGKAYLSDVTFINDDDYLRFVNMLIRRNNLSRSIPTQTFTDTKDRNYILRFSITADYVTSNGFPVVHIRKISRIKLDGDDLVRYGMFDEKVRKYLVDCGKTSRGVVFAGPPGSGKTVCLNWFIDEGYEDTAEILVIQENDELFSNKKGVIFEHVVNSPLGTMQKCTLEDLGQMALVAGANVFVIGEAKGGEICSAITLSNSGCRTAMTIHSPSAEETIDKMADLAMRGYATDYIQAKRMIKSFQTIVYLQDFKVQEIKEIIGFDENKKDMIYRTIYRRDYQRSDKLLDKTPIYDTTGEELFT